ncbi:hypothetical protein RUM43_008006 [Polyplax serrata]|uniref:Uncharacterized protein n=1 Tax=Polyplax serrata TaxID=468196 RepID=A0AAN8PE58_POLSC
MDSSRGVQWMLLLFEIRFFVIFTLESIEIQLFNEVIPLAEKFLPSFGFFLNFPFKTVPFHTFVINFNFCAAQEGCKPSWSSSPCPSFNTTLYGRVRYLLNGQTVSCKGSCPSGTTAVLTCQEFYSKNNNKIPRCLKNGTWNLELPFCAPDCGKGNSVAPLVVFGQSASPGSFPWHVALYNAVEEEHEFWCGGSLISQFAVLTAAHCTWQVKPEKLLLAFGKFRRELNIMESHVQVIEAARIEALESYQDASGNYNGDLSVIFLKKSVEINRFVRPVCLDWNLVHIDIQLSEGTMGAVLGWGITENDTFSEHLKLLYLPVVSDINCIAQQEIDFRKFVTYTSFCAGFANGSGVCNGDSGGGLVFWDEESQRWFLQGLVSVSPRKSGTPHCDPFYYTVFTKVSLFVNWLKKLKIDKDPNAVAEGTEGGEPEITGTRTPERTTNDPRDPYSLIRKYFEKYPAQVGKKQLNFPHSQKILDLLQRTDVVEGFTPQKDKQTC